MSVPTSRAYAEFETFHDGFLKKKLADQSSDISLHDGELMMKFEKYLQDVFEEVGCKWGKDKLSEKIKRLDQKAGSGSVFFQNALCDSVSSSKNILKLQHQPKRRPREEFEMEMTWGQCYCFLYSFRCITQHGNSAPTLTTGAFNPAIRRALKTIFQMKLANSNIISEKQWAGDMLGIVVFLENYVPNSNEELTTEMSYALGLWFPKMVKALAINLLGALTNKFPNHLAKKKSRQKRVLPMFVWRWWDHILARKERQVVAALLGGGLCLGVLCAYIWVKTYACRCGDFA
jgi:hypothetical protein